MAARLCLAALLAGSIAQAADGGDKKQAEAKAAASAAAAAVKDKAKKGAMSPAEIRKLFEEVSKQRDLMIADFDLLTKQMRDATEEEKKKIKEKLEEQKKAFEEVTAALHKQIREEQRKQRQNAAPTKR
jgi:hypothetical protein